MAESFAREASKLYLSGIEIIIGMLTGVCEEISKLYLSGIEIQDAKLEYLQYLHSKLYLSGIEIRMRICQKRGAGCLQIVP